MLAEKQNVILLMCVSMHDERKRCSHHLIQVMHIRSGLGSYFFKLFGISFVLTSSIKDLQSWWLVVLLFTLIGDPCYEFGGHGSSMLNTTIVDEYFKTNRHLWKKSHLRLGLSSFNGKQQEVSLLEISATNLRVWCPDMEWIQQGHVMDTTGAWIFYSEI